MEGHQTIKEIPMFNYFYVHFNHYVQCTILITQSRSQLINNSLKCILLSYNLSALCKIIVAKF